MRPRSTSSTSAASDWPGTQAGRRPPAPAGLAPRGASAVRSGDSWSGTTVLPGRGQRHRALHLVAELADVAWPPVGGEQAEHLGAQLHVGLAEAVGRLAQEERARGGESRRAAGAAAGCGCGSRSGGSRGPRGTCLRRPAARGRRWWPPARGRRPTAAGCRRPAGSRSARGSAAAWAARRSAGRRLRRGTACRRRRRG